MSTTNPVHQVLTTGGNQSPLAAGNPISALAAKQVGVFNAHTGLSLGAASALADCQDFFLAVGVNRSGAGGGATLEDVRFSAGQHIQAPLVRHYTNRCYTAPGNKIVDIGGFAAKCETEYGIKIELRNSEVFALNGSNQFAKSFFIKTACCSDQCEPCADGDCNEIATKLMTEINLDPDQMVIASLVATRILATINGEPTADGNTVVTVGTTQYTVAVLNADTAAQTATKIATAINDTANSPYRATATGANLTVYPKSTVNGSTATFAVAGSGVTANAITPATKIAVADLPTLLATYPGVCVGIRLTTNPAATYSNGDISIKYFKMRGTDIIVSLVEGFNCNGSVVTIQEGIEVEGSGYDLKQLEYEAAGWGEMGPYRVSELLGLAKDGYEYFITGSANYSITTLGYDVRSQSNFLHYENNTQTTVAIPCGDTTTLTELIAILDHILPQFPTNAGNAALCDCTGDESTNEYAVANNGIKMVTT